MPIKGIQRLSKNNIEIRALEIIECFDPAILLQAQPTPIIEFVQHLKKDSNTIVDFAQNLGETKTGNKILGQFGLNPPRIYIDNTLKNDPKFKFTLAHELGHLFLHREIEFTKEDYDNLVDTELDIVTHKRILKSDRDWIEWQANQFAAAFLLPRATFRKALINIQKEMGVSKNLGIIYLDKTNYSMRDFVKIKDILYNIYNVNKTIIEYRLNNLGILNDQRFKNFKHISQVLKEMPFKTKRT